MTTYSKVAKGEALIDAKNWCAMEYDRAKRHHLTIQNKKRAAKGSLEKLILQASRNIDVPVSYLNIGTILGRTKPTRKLMRTHRGPLSPMHKFDAHLVKVVLLRGVIHQLVSCGEGLQLANLIIEGTISQLQLIQRKITHIGMNNNKETAGQLGQT
jgi:hypothetical protein